MRYLRLPLFQLAGLLGLMAVVLGSMLASALYAGAGDALRARRDAALAALERQRAAEIAGQLQPSAARQQALLMLAALQDAGSGVLWVTDAEGRMLLDTRVGPGSATVLPPPDLPDGLWEGAYRDPGGAQSMHSLSLRAGFLPWDWKLGMLVYLEPVDERVRQGWFWIGFSALFTFAVLALSFGRSITRCGRQLEATDDALVALVHSPRGVRPDRLDLPERMVRSVAELRDALLHIRLAEATASADRQRLMCALDKASVSLMLTDEDGQLVYANGTVRELLRPVEPELRIRIPDFSVDGMEGRHFREFHPNNPHMESFIQRLTDVHAVQIPIGGHVFRLVATPVRDEQEKRLGTLVEWHDLTAEVAVGEAMSALVVAAARGDFSHRLSLDDKRGSMRILAEGINALVSSVAGSLDELEAVIGRLSRGDLTGSMGGDAEGSFRRLREGTNATLEHLRDMVGSIRSLAHSVSLAASEIASGNSDLSLRSEEQASALLQSASAMDEISETVHRNADHAREAQLLASETTELAERGVRLMKQVEGGMDAIRGSTRRIADILGVIDVIAFQTNLLALNAAVEAARAGAQGKGFAVVAAEVRVLAQNCADAAREIKTLITTSADEVARGGEQVDEAGQAMGHIVASFHRLEVLVGEIALASAEQSHSIDQVRGTLGRAEEITQHNAFLVQDLAATAESLDEQAHGLRDAVDVFRLDLSAAEAVGENKNEG